MTFDTREPGDTPTLTEGWRPDPATAGQERWFDGTRWTNLTRPAGAQVQPLTQIPVRQMETHSASPVTTTPYAPYTPGAPPAAPPSSAPPSWTQVRPVGDVFGSPVPSKSGAGTALTLFLVVVLLLASGAGVYIARRDTGPSFPKIWDERVADLAYFVESERGARFKHPIHVDFVAVTDFKADVNVSEELTAEDRKELGYMAGAMRAVGMMSGPVDIEKEVNEAREDLVIGYYDPDTKRISIRGTTITPRVKTTIVHELTHALQDQLYDLKKLRSGAPSDLAMLALIEGDASRVEGVYEESLTDAEKADIEKEGGLKPDPPLDEISRDVLSHSMAFPYIFGPAFLEVLIKLGGTAAFDEVYSRPPKSEAEIINPFLYLSRVELDLPSTPPTPAGHKVLDFGDGADDFGQLTLFEMLATRIGFIPAWKALKGWRGDRMSLTSDPSGKVCVGANVRFDTDASAAAFPNAALPWADMVKGSIVVTGKDALIRACDPGADAPAWPAPVEEGHAFMMLVMRAGTMLGMLGDDQWTPRKADCFADALLEVMGAETLLQLLKDEIEEPEWGPAKQRDLQNRAVGCATA